MKKIFENKILDTVFAVICAVLAILIAIPAIGLGDTILDIFAAVALALYIIFYLVPKFTVSGKRVRLYVIVEIVLLSIVALGLVFKQFEIINLSSTCAIFGFAVWLHGIFGCLLCYVYKGTEGQKKYPMWALAIYLVLVSFGMYTVAKPFISDEGLTYVLAALFIVLCFIFTYYAVCGFTKNKKRKK